MKAHLLIIDPQNDFCDPDKGTLYVPGADQDMVRLAKHVDEVGDKYSEIHVTMDSHPSFHIAHPIFWVDDSGAHPDPFTVISEADVLSRRWFPTVTGKGGCIRDRAINYVKTLAVNGRYELRVWTPHCLIGSWGQGIYPALFQALAAWEARRPGRYVNVVTKGSNPLTEHYSAIQADVPDPEDPSTQLNTKLLLNIDEADRLALAGEASSHCLATTALDACNFFQDDRLAKKLVLLKDAASPVTGCEFLQDNFLNALKPRGMEEATCAEFLH